MNFLEEFRKVNIQRAKRWHKNGLDEWTCLEWGGAFGGEAGELLNVIKKYRRFELGLQQSNVVHPDSSDEAEYLRDQIIKEAGDALVYLDILAHQFDFTLENAIRTAFNQISEREGFPERI